MIGSANSASLMIGVQASGASATSGSKATVATDQAGPTRAEQKRQQAETLKLQQFQGALTTLKGLHDASKATAAGLAAQKLEALKQRLKQLMMFGGDPKQVAREAAEIAKEIGEAAKAYAGAAGGGSAGAEAATPVTAANGPPASSPDEAATAAPATATANLDQNPAAGTTGAATAGAATDPAKPSADKTGGEPKDAPTSTDRKPTPAASAPRASGPDPVLEEAKQLAARAKAILKAAIERAKLQHADPAELQDDQKKMNAAEKDIRDAEKALGAGADAASSYSATGQGVAADATAAPSSISVQT